MVDSDTAITVTSLLHEVVVTKTDGVLIMSVSMEETRYILVSMVAVAMFVDGDLGAAGGSDVVSFVYLSGE